MTAKTRSTSSTQRHLSTDLTDFEWECLLSSASFAFPGHIASSSSLRQSNRTQRTEETISEQIFLNQDLAAILRPRHAQTISSNSRALLVEWKWGCLEPRTTVFDLSTSKMAEEMRAKVAQLLKGIDR